MPNRALQATTSVPYGIRRMDDDGFVYLADRIKDMIIIGGENVYSVEVENVIAQHPAVAMYAVIGVPDDDWGERVHAVVLPAEGHTLELDELREFCRERIAGYKIPRSRRSSANCPSPRPARCSSADYAGRTGRAKSAASTEHGPARSIGDGDGHG